MTNSQTAAIELTVPAHQAGQIRKEYLVMAAHAGRRDRTGSKVHLARITYWVNGNRTISGVNCSANGQLRGTLVQGRDFTAVTCKRCGCGDDAAARRNGKAVIIDVATGDVVPTAEALMLAEARVMQDATMADPATQAAMALMDDQVGDLVAAAESHLDAAFLAVPTTQRQVIVKLAETKAPIVRLPGGFWTYDGCPVNQAGIPDWWVTWPTVRAMDRKGLLVRAHVHADAWKDHRTLPAQPKAVVS